MAHFSIDGAAQFLVVVDNNAQSLQAVFGDDITGTYGTDWIVFSYDPVSNIYAAVNLGDALTQGAGYWIIHRSGSEVALDLPVGSTQTPVTHENQCVSTGGCYSIPLVTKAGNIQWNMLGHPFPNSVTLDRLRIVTNREPCVNGCTLSQAKGLNIVDDKFWHFNGCVVRRNRRQ